MTEPIDLRPFILPPDIVLAEYAEKEAQKKKEAESRPKTPTRKQYPLISDPRSYASPLSVTSHSLVTPGASEIQSYSKMGATLQREVRSGKLVDMPCLIEDKLSDASISRGMGVAKYPDSAEKAAGFSVTVAEIMEKLKGGPSRIGKYMTGARCWDTWRTDRVEGTDKTGPQTTKNVPAQEGAEVRKTEEDIKMEGLEGTSPDKESKELAGKSSTKAKGKGNKGVVDEERVSTFFNEIADFVRNEYGIDGSGPDSRVFSPRFKDKAPRDAPVNCIRKPDCVMLDRSVAFAEDACWSDIHALVEVKLSVNSVSTRDAFREMLNCARLVFASQPGRRFVLGTVLRASKLYFVIFDRSGVLASNVYDINEDPGRLVRIILGLLFVDDIRLGYDPTVQKMPDGRYKVELNNVVYDCDPPLYVEKSVRGRGTSCFKTIVDGEAAVIKDAWVDDSRKKVEHQILEKLEDVKGVVKVVDHGIVEVESRVDSTKTDREVLARGDVWKEKKLWKHFLKIETRTHRRIMMKPYGEPLESFANLKELLEAIRDIIKTIEDLIDRGVLHRDISLRNLILAREDVKDPTSRIRGYIIDFDYALDLDDISDDIAKGARTGTLPFMALEMLESEEQNKVPHAYYHDLESVFYAFCWVCIAQEGPNNTERIRELFDFDKSEIARWNGVGLDNPNMEDLRRVKAATVRHAGDFSKRVLREFAPYFDPIKPCVAALRRVMVNQNSNVEELALGDREEIEEAKAKLRHARENGKPVDKILLSMVPNSERDYRDVFRSIDDILKKTIDELKEPEIPAACKKEHPKPAVKVSRSNARHIRTVRDLVDDEVARKALEEAREIEEQRKKEEEKISNEDGPVSSRLRKRSTQGSSSDIPAGIGSFANHVPSSMDLKGSHSGSYATGMSGGGSFKVPSHSALRRVLSTSNQWPLRPERAPTSRRTTSGNFPMLPPPVPAHKWNPEDKLLSPSPFAVPNLKTEGIHEGQLLESPVITTSPLKPRRSSRGRAISKDFSSILSARSNRRSIVDEADAAQNAPDSSPLRYRGESPGPCVPVSVCSSVCSTASPSSKRKSREDDDDALDGASDAESSISVATSSSKKTRRPR